MTDPAYSSIPDLRFSWNPDALTATSNAPALFFDETLRDGIQAPYVGNPSLKEKLKIVDHMISCGVKAADLGFPGSSPAAAADCEQLARHIARNGYPLQPGYAGRTHKADVLAICDMAQLAGIAVDAYIFTGVSPIRQYVEGWNISAVLERIRESAVACEREGVNFVLVLEDTLRCTPEILEKVYAEAIDLGVGRLTLCDTVGVASPAGTRALVQWTMSFFSNRGHAIKLDWHGHNDRGLALVNSLTAAASGCDRVHGTVLGIGERAGNSSIDQMIVNSYLDGDESYDLVAMREYCEYASQALSISIPGNYPAMGREVFKTSAGVHAAALLKAHQAQDEMLKDSVYSSIPARMLAREQEVLIDSASGASNVRYWLAVNGLSESASAVDEVLEAAKVTSRPLSDEEIRSIITNAR